MRLGEGTAAPVLRAAVATLSSMATFASAKVSNRVDDPPFSS
jgi:nicotinate-nucleotide--dimethylbenzimidazole phosphoribosyltransferase